MPDAEFAEVSFYIVPHADDWQLFMHPNAYNDLVVPGNKVVFVITTAGDGGADEKYWLAREEGTKSSIRFCLAPFETLKESNGVKEFNNHPINYWSINNVMTYFFRLPDGNLDGNGFAAGHYQSLSKFKSGKIRTIMAVDSSTIYDSWSDFYTTLESIIMTESAGNSNEWINYLNPNEKENPNDHPDHIATGKAIQNMSILPNLKQSLFVGYNCRNASQNLHPSELFWKTGMFAAYEKAVFDGSGYSTLNENIDLYYKWCIKSAHFKIRNS